MADDGTPPRVTAPRAWLLAIRPKTLSATAAPVAVGSALAAYGGGFRPWPAAAALLGALFIQIGTNLANDVLDAQKGADTAERLGPTRVVSAGLLSARAVWGGVLLAFGLAVLCGLYLASVGGWPIVIIGLASLAAGLLYTGGPYPLAYVGLGDLFVLVFFGLIAVAGTTFVQLGRWSAQALLLGVSVGLLSVAILTVNNLRDIDTDRAAGKRTLIVRRGAEWGRTYYATAVALAFVIPVLMGLAGGLTIRPSWGLGPASLLVLGALPLASEPIARVRSGSSGRALLPVLGMTARLQVAHAALLSLGIGLDAVLGGGLQGWPRP